MISTLLTVLCMLTTQTDTPYESSASKPPVVMVHAREDARISNDVTVSIVNLSSDVGMLITAVEFEGQLPEERRFYHGIAGAFRKQDNHFTYSSFYQTLSRPVASCFLLPGQSTSWERPLRVYNTAYNVNIEWIEIPEKDFGSSVWFCSGLDPKDVCVYIYKILSMDNEVLYSSISSAEHKTPNVIFEGEHPEFSAVIQAQALIQRPQPGSYADTGEGFPEKSIQVYLGDFPEEIVISRDSVFYARYNINRDTYEKTRKTPFSPTAADFIYLNARSREKTIPCILSRDLFSDIVEVKEANTNRYYYPGITPVPIDALPEILKRVERYSLSMEVKRISPNSLGFNNVLVIGVEIDDRGRRK